MARSLLLSVSDVWRPKAKSFQACNSGRYAPRGYFPVLRAQNFEKTGLERIKIEADGRSHLKPAFVAGRSVLTSLFLPRLLGSNLLVKEAHAANSADG